MKKSLLCGSLILFLLSLSFVEPASEEQHADALAFQAASYMADQAPRITSASITIQPDLLTIQGAPGSYAIAGYYIGTKDTIASATYYAAPMKSTFRISLKDGTYHLWIKDEHGTTAKYPGTITVSGVCTNGTASGVTGEGTVSRCYIYNGSTTKAETNDTLVTCANGYVLEKEPLLVANSCDDTFPADLSHRGVSTMYCNKKYRYSCVKKDSASDNALASLGVSVGKLSPVFSSGTYSYSATVAANVSRVNITATLKDSKSTFVENYGPRSVNLNYGANTFMVKAKSTSGDVKTYTIKITRQDNRSAVNTLRELSVNVGTLSPVFSSMTTKYQVNVAESVTSISISATKTDDKSSFVSGYEPGTKTLQNGSNKIQIKVKSESGKIRTYEINVQRGSGTGTTNPTNVPKLSNLTLSNGTIEFHADVMEYNVSVPYEVQNVVVTAEKAAADDNVLVTGGSNLQVGENTIMITVTNSSGVTSTYQIHLIRKEQNLEVSDSTALKSLLIEGYDLKFDPNTHDYRMAMKKGTSSLVINAEAADPMSEVTITGNENLKVGSEIEITVKAEDGSISIYTILINGIKKGTNWFFILILIILIILVIGYFVLRLMGYQFYFNFSAITDWFKGLFGKRRDDE